MPYLTIVLFATLWLAQQWPPWVVFLVIVGIVIVLIALAAAAGSDSGSGGGGGSSSISHYTSSFDETRSSARTSMRNASDDHLKNVRDTLRR